MGGGIGKNFAEGGEEGVAGWVVGPHGEDTAGVELCRELAEGSGGIERGVAGVEEVLGGVVDVEEDGVEAAGGIFGVEAGGGSGRQREEIAVDEAAARVGGERRAERDEAAFVPFDDGGEGVDDEERSDGVVPERGGGGVAEAETTDDDVERAGEVGQSEVGEGDFDVVEEAGHEELLAEFDFVNFEVIELRESAAAEGEVAEGGGSEVEFFEGAAHGGDRRG